jgi:hypothetical protein
VKLKHSGRHLARASEIVTNFANDPSGLESLDRLEAAIFHALVEASASAVCSYFIEDDESVLEVKI